jgi:hypothetical protein
MNEAENQAEGDLASAEARYQDQCREANERLYAAVKAATNSHELDAAYAEHTRDRDKALAIFTEARRRRSVGP